MRNTFIKMVICVALMIIAVSKISLQTKDDIPSNLVWKDYPLAVVDNKAKKIKVLTPLAIQAKKHAPEEFSTYAKGKIDDIEIILIDANNNGVYNENCKDAMVFGNSFYGVPVSKIINIKDKLYYCKIESTGEKISLAVYDGKCGEIDMLSNFKCPVKLEMLIFSCDDVYLDVSQNKMAILPCGSYNLWLGYMSEKKGSAVIRQNEMKSIEVTDETDKDGKKKVISVQWGAPFKMTCDGFVKGNNAEVYETINVNGVAGEEYFYVTPYLLPEVEILDATKKSVAKGGFLPPCPGASCCNPACRGKGGYTGILKKGATGPFILKLAVKNSIFGELKAEKELKQD
jgi:hypothetical protein